MFPQTNYNNKLPYQYIIPYTIPQDYEIKAPEKEIIQITSPNSELLEKLYKLLDEISNNISLFKRTRQEVREEYPELFKSYGSTTIT